MMSPLLLYSLVSSESTGCDNIIRSVGNTTVLYEKPAPSIDLAIGLLIALLLGLFTVGLAHGFNYIRANVYEDKVSALKSV